MNNNRVVLVGESNPYGSDPYFALYPSPEGCAGHRLCHLVLGMHRRNYLDYFERVNLCEGDWNNREAMEYTIKLLEGGGRFVLLGSKVCQAFGVSFAPFTVTDEVLLRLPHPSGRNRIWNDPKSVTEARACIQLFYPLVSDFIGEIYR